MTEYYPASFFLGGAVAVIGSFLMIPVIKHTLTDKDNKRAVSQENTSFFLGEGFAVIGSFLMSPVIKQTLTDKEINGAVSQGNDLQHVQGPRTLMTMLYKESTKMQDTFK